LIFLITKELVKYHFSDDENNPHFQFFGQLLKIVKEWYDNKVITLNVSDPKYKRLLYFEDTKKIVGHIRRGINPQQNSEEYIRPIFNHYNRFGSTKYVNGNSSKEVFSTLKSHVNFVVMDSGWEGIAAKTLEEIPEVISYVKNHFLGFAIPYQKDGNDRNYFTDFIARVKNNNGDIVNLMIEISGMSQDKAEKKMVRGKTVAACCECSTGKI
jgi:type III restriction enzyme